MDRIDQIRARLHLIEVDLSRPRIAELSGVNRHWLEKFSQGVIRNPTVRNLDALQTWIDSRAINDSAAGGAVNNT